MVFEFSHFARKVSWAVAVLLGTVEIGLSADITELCADRVAIERVYYSHRLGEKPPFEQILSSNQIESMVKLDLKKQTVLERVFGITIDPAMVQAEVQRIDVTTRAPEILAELKMALGGDPVRLARTIVRPILVERLLHERFENDDSLHTTQRQEAEKQRAEMLAAQKSGADTGRLLALLKGSNFRRVTETTWQLSSRPREKESAKPDRLAVQKQFGPNARLLTSGGAPEKFYFEEIPIALRNVLHAQLRRAGDVSAVIKTPGSFLLYLTQEKSEAALNAACLSMPKRSYESWLKEQTP